MPATAEGWAALLRDTAAPVLRDMLCGGGSAEQLAATFRDESGNRRTIDPYLVSAAMLHRNQPARRPPATVQGSSTPDLELWQAVLSDGPVPAGLLSDQTDRPGPLLRHVAATTIEVLTETDLCGLHAAWSLARLGGAPGLAGRCLEAADWHAAELQPDNATQTPWAIHVFIVHGVVSHSATMLAEAESRLHACIVSRGRPDRRSALILDHAASELSLLDAGAKNGRFWFQTV